VLLSISEVAVRRFGYNLDTRLCEQVNYLGM